MFGPLSSACILVCLYVLCSTRARYSRDQQKSHAVRATDIFSIVELVVVVEEHGE